MGIFACNLTGIANKELDGKFEYDRSIPGNFSFQALQDGETVGVKDDAASVVYGNLGDPDTTVFFTLDVTFSAFIELDFPSTLPIGFGIVLKWTASSFIITGNYAFQPFGAKIYEATVQLLNENADILYKSESLDSWQCISSYLDLDDKLTPISGSTYLFGDSVDPKIFRQPKLVTFDLSLKLEFARAFTEQPLFNNNLNHQITADLTLDCVGGRILGRRKRHII